MGSFRDNLQHLRATRNMSQSQLAMLVGVSRQSVAKWEAETSYPEMDKLMKIVDIFDCTIDDLVRGDLTGRAPDPGLSVPEGARPTDICGYDEHMRKRAWRVPLGFGLIILGLGTGNLVEALEIAVGAEPAAFGLVALLVGVAAGLALLVPARMEHRSFTKEHPYVEDFYTRKERESARRSEARGVVVGMAVLLFSMAAPMLAGLAGLGQPLASFAWWACVSAGVWTLVHSILMGRRTEMARYNERRGGGDRAGGPRRETDEEEVRDD